MLRFYFWFFLIWVFYSIISIVLRKRKIGKVLLGISYAAFIFILIESTCLFGLKLKTGLWLFNELHNPNADIFEPHPYLINVPVKNASLTIRGKKYSHNSLGYRGIEFKQKNDKYRIITIGGSTTYGTNVSDQETWPYFLDSLLNDSIEVLNFGIAGHSTVEHIILSSLIIPEYKPDMVIIHAGLNDMRSSHVHNLAPDYADYHAYNLQSALGFCASNNMPRLASLRVLILISQKIGYYPLCPNQKVQISGSISPNPDFRAIQLYQRNLETISAILQQQKVKTVFLPQVLIKERVVGDELKWWIPFISDTSLVENMKAFNQTMKIVAETKNLIFINDVLTFKWLGKDFADASHFNADGNRKFAFLICNSLFGINGDTIQ